MSNNVETPTIHAFSLAGLAFEGCRLRLCCPTDSPTQDCIRTDSSNTPPEVGSGSPLLNTHYA